VRLMESDTHVFLLTLHCFFAGLRDVSNWAKFAHKDRG
jgi:hypothetical protein